MVSRLMIYEDGTVTGDFNYVSGYEQYDSNPENNSGWFMPIKVPHDAEKFSVKVNGEWLKQNAEFPDDHLFIVRIREGVNTVIELYLDDTLYFSFHFEKATLAKKSA